MAKMDRRTRLKLIVNPAAGSSANVKGNLNAVTANLEASGFKVKVAWARPKAKATPLAKKAAEEGFEIVAAMGGDGTVEAVMRGLSGSQVRLGLLPTGIQNNIARSLGIPLDLEQACRLIASDSVRKMDVAEVKRGKGEWMSFFEMVGVGYAAEESEAVIQEERPADELFRAQIATAEHQRFEPKAVLYLDDGQRIEVETRLVTISHLPIFGKKLMVPPPESLQDGLLDVSVFQGEPDSDLRESYTQLKTGNYASIGNIQHYQTRSLKLKTFPAMDVIADGMDLGKGTVSLRMCAGALQVMVPHDNRNILGLPRRGYENPAAPVSMLGEMKS